MKSTALIGEILDVYVDRPLGSTHPKWGFRYEVNYGFIPGTISGDGEELDAYILLAEGPLDRFRGECVAVIRRLTESDDKLVVVPVGLTVSELEIRKLTHFQEQFFDSQVIYSQEEENEK